MASASTPPMPSITHGPNWGSVWSPAISSRLPVTMGITRSSTVPSSGRARPRSSPAASRTASASTSRRRTRPRSVLWAIAGPHSFTTTGNPSWFALTPASLAVGTVIPGTVELLVMPMVTGSRELIAGLHTDPQFGPCVMLGIGGVLAEAIGDVQFRLAPITPLDAAEMIDGLRAQALLGPFRGEPPIDRTALAEVLVGLSHVAEHDPDVMSVDLNPLVVVDGVPLAVDALVELRCLLYTSPSPR